jgi:hypothetical protein
VTYDNDKVITIVQSGNEKAKQASPISAGGDI